MDNHRQILIVDDDLDIRVGTGLRLQAAGYHPLMAANGEEGVASAVLNHPDAIVLDIRMPKLDGFGALTRLKNLAETKDIPVVMLSASLGDRSASLEAGARFFLDKPYPGKALLAAVETAIAESSSSESGESS